MSDLRKKIIRLAYQKPELRKDLMSILKESRTITLSPLQKKALEKISDGRRHSVGFKPLTPTVVRALVEQGLAKFDQYTSVDMVGRDFGRSWTTKQILNTDIWVTPEGQKTAVRFGLTSVMRDRMEYARSIAEIWAAKGSTRDVEHWTEEVDYFARLLGEK